VEGIGIDFGTTNSALALSDGSLVRLAIFPFMESVVETFRSVLLFFTPGKRSTPRPLAGPKAVEAYLEPHEGGRLIQSLKSFAANSTFTQTLINGRGYTLPELIGLFLRILRTEAEEQFGPLGNHAVVGRPVRFVGAETQEDEDRALTRLRRALEIAGWENVEFEYEPNGAAHSYAQRLQREELVLIADFGGGTSDFSLVRLAPGGGKSEIIGNAGVPVGGDTFDARIIRHLVSPMLGLGTNYRSLNKVLPVPASLYIKLESWHHLSFLRSRENVRLIESLRAQAEHPERLDRLLEVVQDDLGYHLHRSVQRAKVDLSLHDEAQFVFTDASVDIHRRVRRSQFETWIAPELEQIRTTALHLLQRTGIPAGEVDRVFLTGGSSLVPAVRKIFADQFGEERLAAGDEFTSVARGLALRARRTI
jgi:hypothetical chaperone protein